jgi:hypothetical protein
LDFSNHPYLWIPISAKSRQPRSQTKRILPQTTGLD